MEGCLTRRGSWRRESAVALIGSDRPGAAALCVRAALSVMKHPTPRRLDLPIAVMWMAICGYFLATLFQGVYEAHPNRFSTLCLDLFFVLLFAAGFVAGSFLLIGAGWGRVVLGAVALLAVAASVLGLFAFFNSAPFSVVGVTFDIFAVASAAVLLSGRRHGAA